MHLFVDDLYCSRNLCPVLERITFSLEQGHCLVVTGKNGIGKSTLLRLIAGLLPYSKGKIILEGGNPKLSIAQQAHYIGHKDPVQPELSLIEILDFWQKFLGNPVLSPYQALEKMALDHLADIPAGHLSRGQIRRLSLARLLLVQRPLWLLDEPLAGLDSAFRTDFTNMIQDHLAQKGMILLTSHIDLSVPSSSQLHLDHSQPDHQNAQHKTDES